MFQEAFFANTHDLLSFCDGCSYTYDATNRSIHFDRDGHYRILIGLHTKNQVFVIKRKLTFTKHRYKTMGSRHFIPFTEIPQAKLVLMPWSPMQFVHSQFLYAHQMLTYLVHECEFNFDESIPWTRFQHVCGLLQKSLMKESKKRVNWNPQVAIDLIEQFDPLKLKAYLASEELMDLVIHDSARQEAWLSNFEHLVEIYTNVISGRLVTEEFRCNQLIAVINNCFLGSFYVDPCKMQATMFEEEIKFIDSKVDFFLQTPMPLQKERIYEGCEESFEGYDYLLPKLTEFKQKK